VPAALVPSARFEESGVDIWHAALSLAALGDGAAGELFVIVSLVGLKRLRTSIQRCSML
jgi:hypothetical protein